ncbi:MAG: phenylalanine--tRNA ligase subunit alpha [Nanoarchaeota archaeon]
MHYDFDELEVKILKAIQELKKDSLTIKELANYLNEKEELVLRNVYFLKNKGFLDLEEKKEEEFFIELPEVLPEEELFNVLKEKKELTFNEAKNYTKNLNLAIGELRNKRIIEVKNGKIILVKDSFVPKVREIFEKYKEKGFDALTEEEKKYLKKMKYLKKKEKTIFIIKPKKEAFEINLKAIKPKINKLTKELIKKGNWNLKAYNVNDPVEPIYGGRKHPLSHFIEEIRKIWLSMGFKEKTSNYIVPTLMNFDSVLVPHDHLAREMQDTFYLEVNNENYKKHLEELKEKLFKRVKEIHLKLYGYFDEKESLKWLLRTQDTVVSAYTLLEIMEGKEKIPNKFFSIGKVFRNETVDKTHLAEFFQTEGLVIGKNLKFEHLVFYLKEFFKRLGFKEIKFKIAYFPFTEPSIEVFVYHEKLKKFIELGGAGIFRKEINEIFNIPKEYNILAWGLGLERIAMIKYNLKDIRELEGNKTSIEFLRNYKL